MRGMNNIKVMFCSTLNIFDNFAVFWVPYFVLMLYKNFEDTSNTERT